jgi:hypothetical protein
MKRTVFGLLLILTACSEQEIPVDCSSTDLTIAITKIRYADCGLQNGEITVEATLGKEPYQYQLDNLPFVTDTWFKEVNTGNHSINVKDANGCLSQVDTYIGSKEPFQVNSLTTPSGCGTNSGTITIQPLGGIAPYKYQLGENNDNYQQSNVWTGLSSGSYSIWVEDANTCFFGFLVFVPSGVSYSQNIKPILESDCLTGGCHDGTIAPDLRVYSTVKANATKIKEMILIGSMPPTATLTPAEKELIYCWIDDKTPNN